MSHSLSGIWPCGQVWFYLSLLTSVVVLKALGNINTIQQQHVFPKTASWLLWTIHTSHCEQFSVQLLYTVDK